MRVTRIGLRRRAADQLALCKALEDATQIPAIEPQDLGNLGGRWRGVAGRPGVSVVPDLVEHPSFGQGKLAMEQLLLKDANLTSVETVEAADRVHVLRGSSHSDSPSKVTRRQAVSSQ